MRQKTGEQLELALESRGEAPHGQRSGEAPTTPRGDDRSGGDHRLMEQVVARANALAALKRVKQNKGGPGVDGMTVEELSPYLVTHWEGLREQLLADRLPVLDQIRREVLDRHPVHAGTAPVLLHTLERRERVRAFDHLLHQPVVAS